MKKIIWTAGIAVMVAGVAQATVINFTEMNAKVGFVNVGALGAITEPADQSVLTSLSYTVSGLTIDSDGSNNDSITVTLAVGPSVGAGPINWDNQVAPGVSEFDYNNATFGAGEGISFGVIGVTGVLSSGDDIVVNSALYKEWTVRRWGNTDTMSVVGDVTGTQNVAAANDPSNVALNDTIFSANGGVGTWNGLNVDFTVDVIPEPATLGLVVAFSGALLFIRRLFQM